MSKNTKERRAYLAEFDYGINLTEVVIVSETDKTVSLRLVKRIVGFIYFGKMCRKDRIHLFKKASDALMFLRAACISEIKELKGEIRQRKNDIKMIDGAIKSKPTRRKRKPVTAPVGAEYFQRNEEGG